MISDSADDGQAGRARARAPGCRRRRRGRVSTGRPRAMPPRTWEAPQVMRARSAPPHAGECAGAEVACHRKESARDGVGAGDRWHVRRSCLPLVHAIRPSSPSSASSHECSSCRTAGMPGTGAQVAPAATRRDCAGGHRRRGARRRHPFRRAEWRGVRAVDGVRHRCPPPSPRKVLLGGRRTSVGTAGWVRRESGAREAVTRSPRASRRARTSPTATTGRRQPSPRGHAGGPSRRRPVTPAARHAGGVTAHRVTSSARFTMSATNTHIRTSHDDASTSVRAGSLCAQEAPAVVRCLGAPVCPVPGRPDIAPRGVASALRAAHAASG